MGTRTKARTRTENNAEKIARELDILADYIISLKERVDIIVEKNEPDTISHYLTECMIKKAQEVLYLVGINNGYVLGLELLEPIEKD